MTKTRGMKKALHTPLSVGARAASWFCFQTLCPHKHIHPKRSGAQSDGSENMLRASRSGSRSLLKALFLPDSQLTPVIITSFSFPRSLAAPTFATFFLAVFPWHWSWLLRWGPPRNLTSSSCPHAVPSSQIGPGPGPGPGFNQHRAVEMLWWRFWAEVFSARGHYCFIPLGPQSCHERGPAILLADERPEDHMQTEKPSHPAHHMSDTSKTRRGITQLSPAQFEEGEEKQAVVLSHSVLRWFVSNKW